MIDENDIATKQNTDSPVKAVGRKAKRKGEEEKQDQYIWATGKRKCAVAQVRIFPGNGEIIINDRPYEEVFPRLEHRHTVESPFLLTNTMGKFRTTIKAKGGGVSGQAAAIRHGIARALVKENELFKPVLRKEGLLTRDARVKERKKYGLKRARKAPQYTKR